MVPLGLRFARSLAIAAGVMLASSVAAAADDAPTFRIDPFHSGAQASDVLHPPLTRRWSLDLGGPVYFPLIIGGTAFVVAGNMPGNGTPNYGSQLYSINLASGRVNWGPVQVDPWGGGYYSGLAYDGGRLFVLTGSGYLRAIDPATGADLWPPLGIGGLGVNAQPTAVNGVVYVSLPGNQYTPPGPPGNYANVAAVRERDGQILWQAGVDSGDFSAPVVTASGVYVTNACKDTWDFDPATGAQIWHYQTGCIGGGGTTPALWQGRLYVRDDPMTDPADILNASTGAFLGNVATFTPLAFNGDTAFVLRETRGETAVLQAIDLTTMAARWTVSPPAGDWFSDWGAVYANGKVYVSTQGGQLMAVDAGTGSIAWSANVGTPITWPSNMARASETSGISVGNGWLLLPVGTALVAYSAAGSPTERSQPPAAAPVPFRPRPGMTAATPGPPAAPALAATTSRLQPERMSSLPADGLGSWGIEQVAIWIGLDLLGLGLD